MQIKLLFIIIFTIIFSQHLKGSDTWIESNNGISDLSISSITIDEDDNIFASNNGAGVFYSNNHGLNWSPVNNGLDLNVIKLAANDSGLVFAGTAGHGLYMTSDKGLNWTKVFDVEDTSHYIRSIVITDNNYEFIPNWIFISVDYEGILYSRNNGLSWQPLDKNNYNFQIINSLAISRNEYFFIGTQGQGLLRTTDFGVSWDSLSCPSAIIKSLLVTAQGRIFAGNANGKIYRSFDNGDSWDERASLYYSVNQMIESKEGVIYAALNNNGPYLSPDYGQLWGPFTYGIGKRTVLSICESNKDTLYCGTETGIYKTVLDVKPLIAPVSAYPQNNAYDLSSEISFYWYRGRTAEKHEFVISHNSNFSDIFLRRFLTENQTSFSDSIDNLQLNTSYYWKVRSIKQSDTSAWSEVRKFTTKLNAPNLLSPGKEVFNLDTTVVLTWEDVDNAENYWLQIYGYEGSDLKIKYSDKQLSSTSFTFSAECNNTYFWRLKSINQFSESDWSGYFKFTTKLPAPTLVNPSDNADDLPDSLTFEWEYPTFFTNFDIEIATDSNFKNVFFTDPNVKQKTIFVNKLGYGKIYYWRVKVKFEVGISYWSDVFTFRTGIRAPTALAPENNSIGNPKDIQFEWDMGILNDTTAINGYLIQISKYEDFKKIIFEDSSLQDNSFQYNDFDYDTKYYWRVKANLNGYWTLFSEVWNFKIGLIKPITISPENQSKNVEIPVVFSWEKPEICNDFNIQISNISDMKSILHDIKSIRNTGITIPDLKNDTQYYWKLRYTTDSNMSIWTEIKTFRTVKQDLGIPVLLFPPDSSIEMDTSLYLNWTDSIESNTYHLQVSGNMEFQNPVVDEVSLIEREYLVSGLKHNKKYYWRVRNSNGYDFGEYSKVFNFTTKAASSVKDDNFNDIKIYISPNPASEYIEIFVGANGCSSVHEIKIFNTFGQSVINYELAISNNVENLRIDVSQMPVGMYYVSIENKFAKFVVLR